MTSHAKTVKEYLASLPADRQEAISAVRKVILENLSKGYEECMQYGMISYVVPHRLYPSGYHCDPAQPLPYAYLGARKSHMALYLMTIYGHRPTLDWFRKAWLATGKKLDMGKACVRFKKLEDLPLDVIGELIGRVPVEKYVATVEHSLKNRVPRKRVKKAA